MINTLTDRRVGMFRVAVEIINTDPEAVRAVMADVVVVKADFHTFSGTVEYVALCDDFPAVRPAEPIPYYRPELHKGADGRTRLLGWSGGE